MAFQFSTGRISFLSRRGSASRESRDADRLGHCLNPFESRSMWKTLFDSVQGVSHRTAGIPCQDNCFTTQVRLPHESFLLLACADGAGVGAVPSVGSRTACETFIRHVANEVERYCGMPPITRDVAVEWLHVVYKDLEERRLNLERQSATGHNASGGLVGETCAAFVQVGDGPQLSHWNPMPTSIFFGLSRGNTSTPPIS